MLLPKYLNLVYAVGGGLAGAVGGGVGTHFLTSKTVEIFKPLTSEQRFVDFIREGKDFLTFEENDKATKDSSLNKIEVTSKEKIKFTVEFKELEKDKEPTLNLDFDFSTDTTKDANDKSKWSCVIKASKAQKDFVDKKDDQIKNYWAGLGLADKEKPNLNTSNLSSLLRRCMNGKLKSFADADTKREAEFDFLDQKTNPDKVQFSIIY